METNYEVTPSQTKRNKIRYTEKLMCNDLYVSPPKLWKYGAYIKRKYYQGVTVTYNQMFSRKEIAEIFIKRGHHYNHNMKGLEEHCLERPY